MQGLGFIPVTIFPWQIDLQFVIYVQFDMHCSIEKSYANV